MKIDNIYEAMAAMSKDFEGMAKADQEGEAAALSGSTLRDNPYHSAFQEPYYDAWREGFHRVEAPTCNDSLQVGGVKDSLTTGESDGREND